uniref:VTT domain-containing protein n=1 Tax=Alexandrium andersonii TaxID=327968 RepID=A0A7S2BN48_9DINO|mmetsp:Transcript_27728/g.63048  ORF Transcript_27728/g.63048 Transcript_27728/m.63048 type:complete len:272 (+) Transcript_27728:69-884(+)
MSVDQDASKPSGSAKDGSQRWRILTAGLVICISALLYIRFHHLLTIASLRRHHTEVLDLVEAHPRLAPMCYIGTLILVIGITCPGATMLSFIGGILFKQPYASCYAYIGYIVGASISYLVTSFILGDVMRRRLAENSQLYQKFEANVRRNAFAYLVAARYTMVFPFFFVNAAAALVGVRWRIFVAATSVSCIPGAVIYTTAGGALANLLHKIGDDDVVDKTELIWLALKDPNVKICLVGLSIALVVVASVHLLQSRGSSSASSAEKADKAE